MLRTRFTEAFEVERPVVLAPMSLHASGSLAAAVSAAGGLGTFGALHRSDSATWVHEEAARVRAATDRPFGVGFITFFLDPDDPGFAATEDEHPAVVFLSFGEPGPWVERAHAAGAKVLCQVQHLAGADEAVEAGADAIVAEGHEAGGHTGAMGTLPFVATVAARHPEVPLLAAGGIGDGRTLAAALVAGADGAVMGTAFLSCPESQEVDSAYKDLVVQSDGGDTVATHAYDVLSGMPWPAGVVDRVHRNALTARWEGREAELRARREEVALEHTAVEDEPDERAVRFGQSAAFVSEARPAGEVLRACCEQAEEVLRSRPGGLLA